MATKDRTSLKNDFANGKYATGEKFADLIDSMKVVQLPVVDPQALGTSLTFIDSISQDVDGKITVTKKRMSPTVGSFQFVANDATAEAAFTAVGAKYSGAISGVSPSADTLGVILLMNDDDTTPTKTMMITTEEVTPATNPATYQFVYVGDLSSALPSGVLTVADIVNGFTGGADKVLSAEAGKNMHDMLFGGRYTETNSQATSGSYWKNTDGSVAYGSSSMGLNRVAAISVQAGKPISLTTTLGNTTADAAYFTDNNDVIKHTINRTQSATTTFNGNVPDDATKLYVNYYDTFSVQLSGSISNINQRLESVEQDLEDKQDTLEFDDVPTVNSVNPVKSDGIYTSIAEVSQYFNSTAISGNKNEGKVWENVNGIATENTSTEIDTYKITVDKYVGRTVYLLVRFKATSTNKIAFITDGSENIIQTIDPNGALNQVWVVIPDGAVYLCINEYKKGTGTTQPKIDFKCEVAPKYPLSELMPRSVVDEPTTIISNKADMIYGYYSGQHKLTYSSYLKITEDFIEIPVEATITTKLVSPYRAQVTFFNSNKEYLSTQEWYGSNHTYTTPENAKYIRVAVAPAQGDTNDFDFDACGLEIGIDKSYIYTRAVSQEDVENVISSIDVKQDIIPFAPDPQLPAGNESNADFNAETVTSIDLHNAFDALIDSMPTPFSLGSLAQDLPKYITKYSVVGTEDSSYHYDIKSYILGNRNRYAWKNADYLFGWKFGSTIVYTESISPRVGDVIYSDANRTDSGNTVSSIAYDTTAQQFTITASNSVSYTKDNNEDILPDVVYTKRGQNKVNQISLEVYNKNDILIGSSTNNTQTTFKINNKTYTRCPDYDYHTDQKGVICLWANEHGPTSDPMDASIVLYRIAEDLCGCCRNNPYISYIKQNYKIVLIPCVNPYGINRHQLNPSNVEGRNNFNNVNINRNYPTPGWYEVVSSEKGNYPADQSETQYVINTCYKLGSTFAIDIHCLGFGTEGNDGMCHWEGYVPDSIKKGNDELVKIMGGLGFRASSYGDGNYNAGSQGADWVHFINIAGGLIEMNAGPYSSEHVYNGKQHTKHYMLSNYTLLLCAIKMWLGLTEE